MRIARIIGGLAIAAALFAPPVSAEDETADFEGVPAYSVTRLKIYEGSAWVRTPDSGDWEEFPTNSPVPARSLVSIPEGSEAELQFHGGQFVLLTGGTEIAVRGMEENRTVFHHRSGEIRFYLPESDFAPVRVVTPDGRQADFPLPGRYWMTAFDGETTLIVREGEGTITAESGEIPVKAGEEAVIGNDVLVREYAGDDRDFREDLPPLTEAETEAGVPPAAAQELREYGEWVSSGEYGYVWRPRVAPGWSPYYYGQWTWISPYGWTWLSYEPWGWYPYHYGYWYVDPAFGWVWSPYRSFFSVSFAFGLNHYHHFHRRAHFRPANVRFVRDGRTVRWVPLRPGERARRIPFTRSDRRLASWERPLQRGTVFVRRDGGQGREWRDWTVVRRERRQGARVVAPSRRDGGRVMQDGVERSSPPGRERATGRNVRERDERSREIRGERVRPARERNVAPNRGQRESPASSRPDRRSQNVQRENRMSAGAAEKYGTRQRRPDVSPARRAVPGPTGADRVRSREERYGDRGRDGVRPSGRDVRRTPPAAQRQRIAAPQGGRAMTAPRGRQGNATPREGLVTSPRERPRVMAPQEGRRGGSPRPSIERAGGGSRGSAPQVLERSSGSRGRGFRLDRGGGIGAGSRGGGRGRSVR